MKNKEAFVPSEDFLAVLRNTDSLEELTATQQIVRHEIAVQRSRDTGGEQDEQVKQQLKSLVYVEEIITSKFPLSPTHYIYTCGGLCYQFRLLQSESSVWRTELSTRIRRVSLVLRI